MDDSEGTAAVPAPTAPRAAPRVTREDVLGAAMRLVRDGGTAALSMRKLAAELGVAVTSIYWHVGNRDALVDELVDRVIADMEDIRVTGRTPAERIASIARENRRLILERPHLVGLVRERGLDSLMMLPARRALIRELAAAGLHGERAAVAVKAVQFQTAGFVMLERALADDSAEPEQIHAWREEIARGGDPELAAHLSPAPPGDALFDLLVGSLVAALLAGPASRAGPA